MSSDAEQFEITVKAAGGDGLIDGDPWKYEARCEREAKERALEEVARLRRSYEEESKRADILSEEAQRLHRINLQLSGDFNEQEGNLEFLRTVRRDLEKALDEERKGRAADVAKLCQEVEEANKVNAALHGEPLDGKEETFRKLWDEEKRAKAVEVDRVCRLRDEATALRDENASLRKALEVEARYSSEAKAIIESERAVRAERGETVESRLRDEANALRKALAAAESASREAKAILEARHRAEVVRLNAEAIEREARIQDLEERLNRSLEERDDWERKFRAEEIRANFLDAADAEVAKLQAELDAMAERHRAELASLKESAAHVEPLLARIAEAERKLNRGLTLGLDEQRRADRLQVGLDMANKARAELEEILSAWEETFNVASVWAPPAAYDEDGEAIERDRGDWTVEEWRAAILATSEHLRAYEVKSQRSANLLRSMHNATLEERDSLRRQLTEAEGAIRMLRVWCNEIIVDRFKAEQSLALLNAEMLRPDSKE